MRTPDRLLGPLLAAVLLAASCSTGNGSSDAPLPLHQVAEVALPGDTSRMDYTSLDPSRHRLFIAHLGASQVIVVDTDAKRVTTTLDHVADVHGVLAVPELNRVYATATGSNEVVTFDATTVREIARAATGGTPDGLAYDPDTHSVFISNEDGPSVTEIDALTGSHRRDIPIGGQAGNTAYDPATHHVFVDVQDHDELAEIDPTTDAVVARHTLPGCHHDHGLLIDPHRHRAFVACDGNAKLLEIDLDTFRAVATLTTGADPDVLTLDTAASRLYLLAESGTVTVADTTNSPARLLTRRPLASGAHSGTVDPLTHTLFVPLANAGGHPVLRIFEPTGITADAGNVYAHAGAGMLSAAVAGALPRVYVPNLQSNDVSVIDPATRKVTDRFPVGRSPQHIVPAWDLQTLWVTNNAEGRTDGSLTPIDPKTGKPGTPIPVDDPYNLYFTTDGRSAIVVAEARKRLDFRDPHTMQLQQSVETPDCGGINHADFASDGSYAVFTCEYDGRLVKIDLARHTVTGYLTLSGKGMPQDIRIAPNGKTFYVAEMMRGGVYTIDAATFTETGFIPTGVGTHGLYPSRDATQLVIANRGSTTIPGKPHGPGSIAVLDFTTNRIVHTWPIPGGGSPDMGNITADGSTFWVSGRYDNVVYAFDTHTGAVLATIPVGTEPHGLTVWPQPGRFSLGHTGNMR